MKLAKKHAVKGVTLLELLTVTVIVTLLFGLAIPAWRDYLRKAHRTEAMSTLMHAATRQEQFRLINHRYANGAELHDAPPAGLGIRSDNASYDFRSQAGPENFKVSATAKADGPQMDDDRCLRLAIDEAGRRTAADGEGSDTTRYCWPMH